MKFSRRHFIKLSSATAAGAFGFGSFVFGQKKSFFADQIPSPVLAEPLSNYTADDFRKFVGTKFNLMSSDVSETAVLTEVKSSISRDKTARNNRAECFTLSFHLPSDAPQATYTVIHPNLGAFKLLLVPGKNDKIEHLLYAVINRI